MLLLFFFFNDTATTEIYTLSLHDALPISRTHMSIGGPPSSGETEPCGDGEAPDRTARRLSARIRLVPVLLDRKSTRLNSSHANISYAVFCLKKKKPLTRTKRCMHTFSPTL